MSSKKEEKKNLNYILKPNKDFSFRNDEINDENENPNKTLISNSSSKKIVNLNKESSKHQIKIKNKKIDLMNQLIVDRLVQENKFLKEEIEIAKSNILILEEKESQYKNTIEHMNIINQEKEISYQNIVSLINNYKQRENQLNYKLTLFSKELTKKNKIINQLNTKINELNERIIKLKNNLVEKNKIINYYSRNKKSVSFHKPYNQNMNNISNHSATNSLNLINHNKKESDINLHYRERTLSNLNFKLDNFNNINMDYINKKNSNDRINTINNIKFYEKLNLNNNNKYILDTDNLNSNTEGRYHISKFVRKNSAYKKNIIHNNNICKNIPKAQFLKKNNSYKTVGYNSVNSTLNKNQGNMNNSSNLIQNKKIIDKKQFKNLKMNSDKSDIKKFIMLTPSNRYLNIKTKKNSNNKNNNTGIVDYNNYSYLTNDEENYLVNNTNNNINTNKKEMKLNKKFLLDKKYNNTNENSISNYKNKNWNKRKIEISKYFINNAGINQNSSFRNILTERKKIF